MNMPKGKRKGVIATHVTQGPAVRAYRFPVDGNAVTLRRAADGWRVVDFVAKKVFPQQGGELILQISPQQDTAAAEAMRAACGIVVRREAARQHVASISPSEAVGPFGIHHAAKLLPQFNP